MLINTLLGKLASSLLKLRIPAKRTSRVVAAVNVVVEQNLVLVIIGRSGSRLGSRSRGQS